MHAQLNRRRRLGAAVVLALAVGGSSATLGAASGASPQPERQTPQSYYLALGDSITYGIQPDKPAAVAPSAYDTGYVDVVAARLRKRSPGIAVVNYGCPGESTVTFRRGGCPWLAEGRKLHDAFRGSQLAAAVSFLRAHPGEVSPITVTLFGNDWFPVLLDRCKGEVACARKRAPGATASFASRLTSILQRLRAAAPTAEIVVTGAWNPVPDHLAQLKAVYRSFDASIARAAAASQARVAKTLPVFNPPGSVRAQQARLCAFSFICSKGDPHPTNAGYRALANAVIAALG
jgi:lysophospholipase L1-like esterase